MDVDLEFPKPVQHDLFDDSLHLGPLCKMHLTGELWECLVGIKSLQILHLN